MHHRRRFLAFMSSAGFGSTLFPGALYAQIADEGDPVITAEMIEAAERIAGIQFTPADRERMLEDVNQLLTSYEAVRELRMPNEVPPALMFDPALGVDREDARAVDEVVWHTSDPRHTSEADIAFSSVSQLAHLLREGEVSSVALTNLYLNRLEQYDDQLKIVITHTRERALDEAEAADSEIRAGNWRGPLHGVPWGAKDLLAVHNYPTTWGASPYRDQFFDYDATVVERLHEAGAVLLAKLALGELAWGDVWFEARANNPWNVEQGASGSSAGSGAGVAAGLMGFAIGSETLGSIVSPSTRNGVTGFRPSFGRVSRHGAMALSWSMDKIGPMARSAEDCALVFAAIHGHDERDPYSVRVPFRWDPDADATRLRAGYVPEAFEADYPNQEADQQTLEVLRGSGIELQPVALPDLPAAALGATLSVEASAAFDELVLTGGLDHLVRQERFSWPNFLRFARMVPAVEYVQANRARTLLIREMTRLFETIDVLVTPSFAPGILQTTNLTGHPAVVVPNAFHPVDDDPTGERRNPGSISFVAGLDRDEHALLVAHTYQRATDWHRMRPPVGR